jgi:dGTPase
MEWKQLLSHERLQRPDAIPQEGRSPFQQDIDRIVFSAAFRRLAHKTQVHPLSPNDHVHTRLTHSIEVASVGRSLGTIVGQEISKRLGDSAITADTFGYVVQAACLAHDIGNPPFGHSGEEAIRSWFRRTENENIFGDKIHGVRREDFRNFEGNAQGFRILTQLENYKWQGGLQLTFAVLATFSKYPRSSIAGGDSRDKYPGGKKIGFFEAERENFSEVAEKVGLHRRKIGENYWSRHPLAFLVEAADDICYAIIDIEDGYGLGYLNFREAKEILEPIAGGRAKLTPSMGEGEQIAKLRAVAIGELVSEASAVFLKNERDLLDGKFADEIINPTKFKDEILRAKELATTKLYWSERKTKLEIAGTEVICGLLQIFSDVVVKLAKANYDQSKLDGAAQRLARLMGRTLGPVSDNYGAFLAVTDFISGMTDRYAVDLYRTLKGIST